MAKKRKFIKSIFNHHSRIIINYFSSPLGCPSTS